MTQRYQPKQDFPSEPIESFEAWLIQTQQEMGRSFTFEEAAIAAKAWYAGRYQDPTKKQADVIRNVLYSLAPQVPQNAGRPANQPRRYSPQDESDD